MISEHNLIEKIADSAEIGPQVAYPLLEEAMYEAYKRHIEYIQAD